MSVLVLSCGRTGTNMLLEIMRGSSQLVATQVAEDKQVFRASKVLRKDYLSKCDTVYVDSTTQVNDLMNKNPHLKILWTIRDPRDAALSKIYRGQPGNDGNYGIADDATHSGCLADFEWMKKIYDHLNETHSDRVKLVKMEDVILNFEETIHDICEFCDLPYEDSMQTFTGRYRLSSKAQRYKSLDKNQINIYKRKYEIYNNFFKDSHKHKIDLDVLFADLEPYINHFGYLPEKKDLENEQNG
jgi:hypothetical protein